MIKNKIILYALLLCLPYPCFPDTSYRVKTLPLLKTSVFEKITALGILQKKPHHLSFKTAGLIDEFYVKEGSQVTKGHLLARLNTLDIDNQLKQSKQVFHYAKQKYERSKILLNNKVSTQDNFEDKEHQLIIKKLQFQNTEILWKKHFLRAPEEGIILQQWIEHSEQISEKTPIFTFKAAKTPWIVTARLTPKERALTQHADSVNISFNAFPTRVFKGKVNLRPGVAESNDGMIEIDIEMENSAPFFHPGLKTQIEIKTKNNHSGFRIPLSSFVQIEEKRGTIFITDSSQTVSYSKKVSFHHIEGSDAIVLTDLSKFSHIIVAGQQNLKDGVSIIAAAITE